MDISNFVKDIDYTEVNELAGSEELSWEFLQTSKQIGGMGSVHATVMQLMQTKEGSQLWVSQDVSNDLLLSDIDPEEICFGEVYWPAKRLEVFFEDKTLPTFLVAKAPFTLQSSDIAKALPSLASHVEYFAQRHPELRDRNSEDIAIQFLAQAGRGEEAALLYLNVPFDEVDDYIRSGGENCSQRECAPAERLLRSAERAAALQMLSLLFRVLLFADSEGHETRRTREQPTKKQGGKAGFLGRPTTERLVVEYLPRHIAERAGAARQETERNHKFRGRRGHWRHYRSERYKKMRGKKVFIFPVPGPDGTVPRKQFKIVPAN
jgi:hypothetical protein